MTWKKIKAVICWVFSGIISVALIVGFIFAYVIRTTDADGEAVDGLGRLLVESPKVISIILRHWGGGIWFGVDCAILIIGIIAANMLIGIGKDNWNNIERDYENNFF